MKNRTRFTIYQQVAGGALLKGAAIATPLLSTFSAWLMGGLGAAFALFITNIASVLSFISPSSLRWALLAFTASLLAGLLARFLSVMVTSGVTSNQVFSEHFAQTIRPEKPFAFRAFFVLFLRGLLQPYRCIAACTLDAVKSGDLMASAKFTAKTSQAQALLVLLQILCAITSICVLACGIKV
jgi:hypothetical protein